LETINKNYVSGLKRIRTKNFDLLGVVGDKKMLSLFKIFSESDENFQIG
jgi:hypothetical protein